MPKHAIDSEVTTIENILSTETVNQNTTYRAFGDSVTAGTGASVVANRFVNKVTTNKGWTLTNSGFGGDRLNDPGITDAIYGTAVTATSNFTLLTGINDVRSVGSNVTFQDSYRSNLTAVLAWLAIPSANKTKAINATTTGTWVTSAATLHGAMGRHSTVSGSTLTFSVMGTVVYVGYVRYTGGGPFKITIDGTEYNTYPTDGTTLARRDASGTYCAAVVRIPNLTNTVHSVVVTTTSTSDTYIDWCGGNGSERSISGPNVWVGNCLRATTAGYSGSSANDTAVGQYNGCIAEATSLLAFDGLNVCHVDASSAVNVSTGMSADGFHPNDTGHQAIANSFLSAMSSVVKPRDRAPVSNSPWQSPIFTNGWVNFGLPWGLAGYMKDANGFVHLRGLVKTGTMGTPIFYLPIGYRPRYNFTTAVRSNSTYGQVTVAPDGGVVADGGSNSHFGIDNVTFLAEG